MRFDPSFPFAQWTMLGERIGGYSNASLWWLGDWLNFGREMYGPQYKRGVELTGLDYKTLRNYAYVAAHIALSRRRDNLSFQHHAEVAPLAPDQQVVWLELAERERWARNELRRRLRDELRRPERLLGATQVLSLQGVEEHQWLLAASRCETDLETWAVRTLDAAAAAQLTHSDGRPKGLTDRAPAAPRA
jgi:hypothetical protein